MVVDTPDAERAAALLDGRVEERTGQRLVVREDDPARLNARLVADGVRVAHVAAEHRSLEQLVLDLTSAGSDTAAAP